MKETSVKLPLFASRFTYATVKRQPTNPGRAIIGQGNSFNPIAIIGFLLPSNDNNLIVSFFTLHPFNFRFNEFFKGTLRKAVKAPHGQALKRKRRSCQRQSLLSKDTMEILAKPSTSLHLAAWIRQIQLHANFGSFLYQIQLKNSRSTSLPWLFIQMPLPHLIT
jgi:hypothetical protein